MTTTVMINEEYIKENCLNSTLASREIRLNCPSCDDYNYHLYYNQVKGAYHCFKCGFSGYLKVNDDFKEEVIEKKGKKIFNLPDGCLPLFEKNKGGKKRKKAMEYILSRGLTSKDIYTYDIHYGAFGELNDRVVFPFFEGNELVYYFARTINNNPIKALNPTDCEKSLFNFDRAKRYNEIVLVEGVFDSIMTGYDSMALLGKTLTEGNIVSLKLYDIDTINIMLDSEKDDPSAPESAKELAKKCYHFFKEVVIIYLPFGDPASLRLRENSCIKSWKGLFREEKYQPNRRWKVELKRQA